MYTDVEDKDVVPTHEGRWKDVNDFIEIGTAYAKGKGLPIEEDVVKYTELQKELHPDKITSPIADFIAREHRLPEPDEIKELIGDVEVEDKELLFKKERTSPKDLLKELSPDTKMLVTKIIHRRIIHRQITSFQKVVLRKNLRRHQIC